MGAKSGFMWCKFGLPSCLAVCCESAGSFLCRFLSLQSNIRLYLECVVTPTVLKSFSALWWLTFGLQQDVLVLYLWFRMLCGVDFLVVDSC